MLAAILVDYLMRFLVIFRRKRRDENPYVYIVKADDPVKAAYEAKGLFEHDRSCVSVAGFDEMTVSVCDV